MKVGVNGIFMENTELTPSQNLNNQPKGRRAVIMFFVSVVVFVLFVLIAFYFKTKKSIVEVTYSPNQNATELLSSMDFPEYLDSNLSDETFKTPVTELEGGVDISKVDGNVLEVSDWLKTEAAKASWKLENEISSLDGQVGLIFEKKGWKNHVTLIQEREAVKIIRSLSFEYDYFDNAESK
jgi:hypothetical protein